jgi:Fe-S-cluster-containing dehydrogenase component
MNRREFLKLTLALFGSLAGHKLFGKLSIARARESISSGRQKWGMVIDQNACVGCGACIKACQANNDINPEMAWNRLYSSTKNGDKEIFTPIACQQCEHAPCVSVCPVGASYRRDDGIVMMDYERCIGCRYCLLACPYGARSFNWDTFSGSNPAIPEWGEPDIERRPRGVVEKCTFCYQRIDRGLAEGLTPGVDEAATPACVNACPMNARIFGDLNDSNSPVSIALKSSPAFRLLESLGTSPRVYYLPPQPVAEESKS